MTPVVSVVVPTYGRPRFLAEALASVCAQSVREFECIVVDDASPQPVTVPPDPRVRLVRLPRNRGVAAARNAGIDLAQGEFIAFLDDDDTWFPSRLQDALAANRTAPVSVCRLGDADGKSAPLRPLHGDVYDCILDGMTPHPGQTMVARACLPRFDESFRAVEDVDWWLRLAAVAQVTTIPSLGFWFRRHDGVRHANGTRVRIAASQQLLDKHSEYFRDHPKAHAFRLMRLGVMATNVGDVALGRSALRKAFLRDPSVLAAGHLLRSTVPGMSRRDLRRRPVRTTEDPVGASEHEPRSG